MIAMVFGKQGKPSGKKLKRGKQGWFPNVLPSDFYSLKLQISK